MYPMVKRFLDVLFSLLGLICLCPVFLIVAVLIRAESKGSVLFKQKRAGVRRRHFIIYKFRTMAMDAPKDSPTHLLADADKYITKVGAFLRRYSLDELPQLYNILRGDMSFVGPRPALWNQFDLLSLRERFCAARICPGLTGWAQINGRDELPILTKARFDGEYAANMSFAFDLKIIRRTFVKVWTSDGVASQS